MLDAKQHEVQQVQMYDIRNIITVRNFVHNFKVQHS